jgi:hypothetical protein
MALSSGSLIKMLVTTALCGAFCAATPSCTDNNETIFIRQVQLPQSPDCSTKNDITASFLGRGFLDVGLSQRYLASVLVGSQLVARGDARQTRAEPNRVAIQGADIDLVTFDVSGNEQLFQSYSVTATGMIDPTSSADPGYGLAAIEMIPPAVGIKLRDVLRAETVKSTTGNVVETYEARIKIFGTTLGGRDVETGQWAFPIDLCYGCSVQFPPDANDPTLGTPGINCLAKTATTASTTTGVTEACFAGQDGVTDCRNCKGSIVCQPCKTATCTGGACGNSLCTSGVCGAAGNCL